ncbi:MAG: hypothetical protein KAW93_04120 [Methanogenium sp.]|nr:hypothetical protein [Methanogenium sp.]
MHADNSEIVYFHTAHGVPAYTLRITIFTMSETFGYIVERAAAYPQAMRREQNLGITYFRTEKGSTKKSLKKEKKGILLICN